MTPITGMLEALWVERSKARAVLECRVIRPKRMARDI